MDAPRKIVSGMLYMLSCTYLGRCYGFVASTILLPRLIDAGTMGGVALGASIFLILMSFKDLGLSFALLHHQDQIDELAPTHFLLNVTAAAGWIGLAISLLLLGHHYPQWSAAIGLPTASLAGADGSDLALWAVICFALFDLLRSASYTAETRLKARLAFRSIALVHMSGLILALTVALVLAYHGMGGWALIIGGAASYITYSPVYVVFTVFCIWRLQPWQVARVKWNPRHARQLWVYGRWYWLGDILYNLVIESPKLVAGFLLGWVELGYYAVAYVWAQMSTGAVTHILISLTNPVYARYQKDRQKLSLAFTKMVRLVARMVLLLNLVFFLEAERLVSLAGDRWAESVPLLKWLIPFALFRPFLDDAQSLLLAVGEPKTITKVNGSQALFSLLAIPVLCYAWGIRGIALGTGLTAMVGLSLSLRRLKHYVDVPWGAVVLRPLLSALVTIGLATALGPYLPETGLTALAVHLPFDVAVYVGGLLLLEGGELRDEWRFVRANLGAREAP